MDTWMNHPTGWDTHNRESSLVRVHSPSPPHHHPGGGGAGKYCLEWTEPRTPTQTPLGTGGRRSQSIQGDHLPTHGEGQGTKYPQAVLQVHGGVSRKNQFLLWGDMSMTQVPTDLHDITQEGKPLEISSWWGRWMKISPPTPWGGKTLNPRTHALSHGGGGSVFSKWRSDVNI